MAGIHITNIKEDIINATTLKQTLGAALDKVEETGRTTIIVRNGIPTSAIVDIEFYQDLIRLAELGKRYEDENTKS